MVCGSKRRGKKNEYPNNVLYASKQYVCDSQYPHYRQELRTWLYVLLQNLHNVRDILLFSIICLFFLFISDIVADLCVYIYSKYILKKLKCLLYVNILNATHRPRDLVANVLKKVKMRYVHTFKIQIWEKNICIIMFLFCSTQEVVQRVCCWKSCWKRRELKRKEYGKNKERRKKNREGDFG